MGEILFKDQLDQSMNNQEGVFSFKQTMETN